MPVLFSRACEYALRALVEMASQPDQKFWAIQELAKQTDVPAPFLAKTFQILVKAKVLNSTKGRGGGFSFAQSADNIFLIKIVTVIDGPALMKDCAMGFPTCGETNPCPFHSQWGGIREKITKALNNKSIKQLVQ